MWKLVIEDDEGKRTVVPLTRDQYSIGRREGNTIRLTERNVSRSHARLYKSKPAGPAAADGQPAFVLEDLTSYNGVFVNGLRVTHAQDLAHGDLVQIGDYRIILQDESLADTQAGHSSDPHQTVPNAPTARAAALLDRPNRLVMLAGPTPGAEFPLDRERLTIGRAEDATISVNHNSVSRLHCEVHALGDGRFEIVDKGSSNGVRVNGAELRRGIVEPGDVIELGDVRFKFIGAGQIFRPTESQQLAAISDRDASEVVHASRGLNALPIAAFVVVVVAGAAGAWVYTRPRALRAAPVASVVAPSPERILVDEAKVLCAHGDCEGAHERLAAIPEGSPVRSTPDFKDVENRWADEILARAEREPDPATKRLLYQRVAQAITVDPAQRKLSADKLQEMDVAPSATATNALQLPIASSAPAPQEAPAAAARVEVARRAVAVPPEPAPSVSVLVPPPLPIAPTLPVTTAPATAPTPRLSASGVDDHERQLALQGTPDSKLLLKQQLEQRVYGGKASDTEIRLLISTCKDLGDKVCVQQARAIQGQRPP
ncbi:MAG TPA: FHA domain-containing protein [Polyangiaceae bacterium]|nr:FHA domain-containing protein [Polyangiaceae bacterium]